MRTLLEIDFLPGDRAGLELSIEWSHNSVRSKVEKRKISKNEKKFEFSSNFQNPFFRVFKCERNVRSCVNNVREKTSIRMSASILCLPSALRLPCAALSRRPRISHVKRSALGITPNIDCAHEVGSLFSTIKNACGGVVPRTAKSGDLGGSCP